MVRNALDESRWALGRTPGVKKIWSKLVRREILARQQCHHPNVMRIIGVVHDVYSPHPLDLSIVTNAVQNETAKSYLKKHPDRFMHIILGLSRAVEYLHASSPPFTHGDIRSRNIRIDLEENAILWDFDLTHARHQLCVIDNLHPPKVGPVRHTAPEILCSSSPSHLPTLATDIYSLAMTMLELATLRTPFAEHVNGYTAMHAGVRGERPRRPLCGPFGRLEGGDADDMWRLSERMWAHDPESRPSAHEVVQAIELIMKNQASGKTDSRTVPIPDKRGSSFSGAWVKSPMLRGVWNTFSSSLPMKVFC